MPSLNVPRTARTNSTSSMRSVSLKARRCGTVASPTPTVPMSSDSMSWIEMGNSSVRARAAAAIQPAVPPPTMTMLLRRVSLFTRSIVSHRLEPDAERAPHCPRVPRDVADGVEPPAGDQAVRARLVDVIHQVFLIGDVEDVEPQVERRDVGHVEVLGDLQVERLVTVVIGRVRSHGAGCAGLEGRGAGEARGDGVRYGRRPRELAGESEAPRPGIGAGRHEAMFGGRIGQHPGVLVDRRLVEGIVLVDVAVALGIGEGVRER